MERKIIYLGTIENAIRFVNIVDNLKAGITLRHGTRSVSGKSILGIFSLNLNEPLDMEVCGDDGSRQEVLEAIDDYIREA